MVLGELDYSVGVVASRLLKILGGRSRSVTMLGLGVYHSIVACPGRRPHRHCLLRRPSSRMGLGGQALGLPSICLLLLLFWGGYGICIHLRVLRIPRLGPQNLV